MAQHGAYMLLLWEYYINGPIEANANSLLAICCGKTSEDEVDINYVLERFFHLEDGFWRHHRADEEIEKRVSVSEKRKLVGRKGGLAKATNLLKQKATQSQSQSHIKTLPPPPEIQERPEGLHPMQYAAHICDELVIPKKGNMETVASTIETLAKSRNTSPCEAHDYLLAKALTAKEAGETVNLFWFRDGKYNITKAVTRDNHKTTAELRNQRSDDSLERAFREVGATKNLPTDVQQGTDKRRGQGVGQSS